MRLFPCSSIIKTVVEKEAEGNLTSNPLCTTCEMAVIWLQNQLKQKGIKEKVFEYVDQVNTYEIFCHREQQHILKSNVLSFTAL